MVKLIRWFKHKIHGHLWKVMDDYVRKEVGLPEGVYKYCTYCGVVEPHWQLRCAHCKRWYGAASFTVTVGGIYSQPQGDRNLCLAEIRHTATRAVCPNFQLIDQQNDPFTKVKTCEFYPTGRNITNNVTCERACECK